MPGFFSSCLNSPKGQWHVCDFSLDHEGFEPAAGRLWRCVKYFMFAMNLIFFILGTLSFIMDVKKDTKWCYSSVDKSVYIFTWELMDVVIIIH